MYRCKLVGAVLSSVVMQAVDSVLNSFVAYICSIDLCGTCCTWEGM